MPTQTARMTGRRSRRERRERHLPWGVFLAIVGGFSYVAGFAGGIGASVWMNVGHAVALALGVVWVFRHRSERAGTVLAPGAALLIVLLSMGIARWGELSGLPLYALSYLAVGAVVAFQGRWRGFATLGYGVALIVGSHLTGHAPGLETRATGLGLASSIDWGTMATRSALMGGFGSFVLFLRGPTPAQDWFGAGNDSDDQRQDLLERAREFRLLNSGRTGAEESHREEVEQYAVMDAVEAVERSIFESLALLKTSLDSYTCVLLWFDVGQQSLRIKELVSDSDAVVESSLDPAQGVLGSIVRCREPVVLEDLREGFRGLSYYRGSEPVRQFLGVPLIEDGHMRGILCVDRCTGPAFEAEECDVVEMVSESILRSVENERIFKDVEATKFELGQFFNASRRLNSVLSMEEVLDAALRSAADVVSYDFGAVTLCEGEQHRIAAVDADASLSVDVDDWQGRRFGENTGLVSMAVKNQHYLPFGGRLRDGDTVVFTREEELPQLESLLVLPLIARDEAIGTVVVGTTESGGVSTERREMLEVIANQVAVSLQNARLYARMEKLATTDELTGLPNRRTFDQKLDEAVARHGRSERTFGLLILDIDHFKSVNDTFGHAVGDDVLEAVADVLAESVREIDVPARYGGEEFAVILEETGLEGARRVAERVRREVAAMQFDAEGESFRCTVSIGLAIWPGDAESQSAIVEAADDALYASKEGGRDRVTAYHEL